MARNVTRVVICLGRKMKHGDLYRLRKGSSNELLSRRRHPRRLYKMSGFITANLQGNMGLKNYQHTSTEVPRKASAGVADYMGRILQPIDIISNLLNA